MQAADGGKGKTGMTEIKIGFLGMGNVGSGAYRILRDNAEVITHREGMRYTVTAALVRNKNKSRGDIPGSILTENPDDVLDNPEIDIVAEFLGGTEPARTYILRALENGKTVVTANKVVLANCWPELEAAAKAHGAGLYYEASVAGGIPIIRTLHCSMQANRINKVMGIINGTTNYILSAMTQEGKSYKEALAEAQRTGLAEPDPTLDVEGLDAAYKLSLLASIAFHSKVPVSMVYHEGITAVTKQDIAVGKELGLTLKLLAIGKKGQDGIEVRVHPTFIPDGHPLSSISGATNAVYLDCDALGELVLSGQGAGSLPTGSAVVSDIIYASKQKEHSYCTFRNSDDVPREGFNNNWESEYFVSIWAPDKPGLLATVAGIFASCDISIASMIQKRERAEGNRVPVIFLTHRCREQSMKKAIEGISAVDGLSLGGMIRVEAMR